MRVTKTAGALALTLTMSLTMIAFSPTALAQQDDEGAPSQVITSEEPGVCSSQGSFCERLLEWTGNEVLAETVAWILGTPVKIAAIMLVAVLVNRLARRGIRRVAGRLGEVDLPGAFVSGRASERSIQRADAVAAMLRSTASALIFGIAGVAILDNVGISVVPIIASLGIAGIAIGFGAQTLIEDLISGVMLVIEDQLGVGDRVDVGVVEGDVERLTLRSTVILARNGVRWYIPNSEIKRVANESQHKARASVQIGVAYDADLRSVASTFHQAVLELAAEPRWQDAGIEDVREPFVASLADPAAIVELRLFIEATERRPFERALRERLVDVASAAGIEIPNNQLDLWVRTKAS
jgi:small-conductance mechanosensitive channel